MRIASTLALAGVLLSPRAASAQRPQIRHVVSLIDATSDEWVSTQLTIASDDIVIVTAPGTIIAGGKTGPVDAAGVKPGGSITTGFGVLEYRIGESAAKPVGTSALLPRGLRGELKFHVKDDRYDDNMGKFQVDVIVIPSSEIPPAGFDPVATGASLTNSAARIAAIDYLTQLRTFEEVFFVDHANYTDKVSDMRGLSLPEGVTVKSLTTSKNGTAWSTIITSAKLAGVQCAMAVNTPNPVDAKAGEGEPICQAK